VAGGKTEMSDKLKENHDIEDIVDFISLVKRIASLDDIRIVKKAAYEIHENIRNDGVVDESELVDALTTFYGLGMVFGVRVLMDVFGENLLIPILRQDCPIKIIELIIEHKEKKDKEEKH
jgi:hypothetical protein